MRRRITVRDPGSLKFTTYEEVNMNKIRAYVSSSPLVHVIVAAFIGGALPVLYPVLQGHDLSFALAKVAAYAGIAAVLRAVVLLIPSK